MRNVFFSFDWDDVWRVNQIRQQNHFFKEIGYRDKAKIEQLKLETNDRIRQWINEQMEGCTCVIILCGEKTGSSEWVLYEIKRAGEKRLGSFIIRLTGISDQNGCKCGYAQDPYEENNLYSDSGEGYSIKAYNWDSSKSPNEIGQWIEDACKRAGK